MGYNLTKQNHGKGESPKIIVRLPIILYRKIKNFSKKKGFNISQSVRFLIERGIKR